MMKKMTAVTSQVANKQTTSQTQRLRTTLYEQHSHTAYTCIIRMTRIITRPDLHAIVDDYSRSLIVDSYDVNVDSHCWTAPIKPRPQRRPHREVVSSRLVAVMHVPQRPGS